MAITLTLPAKLEQRLIAEAEALHLPVQEYLLSLISTQPPTIKPAPLANESDEDFTAAMLSLSKHSKPIDLPYQTWPREEIYRDHD